MLDENRLKLYLISRYYQLGLHAFRNRARGNSYFDTVRQVSDAWKTSNDELLDFAAISNEDPELGDLLVGIRDSLQDDQFIDFSLMIRNVVEAVQGNLPGTTSALASLSHLMVDEYQDVNTSQETLIRLIHQHVDSLFAVGDDDQAIYAWRGADVGNIIDFPQRYPNCSVHTLSQNFRSTQPIVEASDEFASETLGPTRIPKAPTAFANLSPRDLGVLWFPDRTSEARWVAERVLNLLGTEYDDNGIVRGLTPADFAVLMRSTRTQEQDGTPRHAAFTSALEDLGIPFSLEAGGGPFDRPQTTVLRSTFELLRNVPIDRNTLRQHFDSTVIPAYPNADFNSLAAVISNWSRQIHRPQGSTRIKLYPQQLLHDLLDAFNIALTNFSDDVMRDIGLFSRMILDVETVYMSADSKQRL